MDTPTKLSQTSENFRLLEYRIQQRKKSIKNQKVPLKLEPEFASICGDLQQACPAKKNPEMRKQTRTEEDG